MPTRTESEGVPTASLSARAPRDARRLWTLEANKGSICSSSKVHPSVPRATLYQGAYTRNPTGVLIRSLDAARERPKARRCDLEHFKCSGESERCARTSESDRKSVCVCNERGAGLRRSRRRRWTMYDVRCTGRKESLRVVARERRGLGGQISIQNSSARDGKCAAMRMARREGQGRTSVWREGAGRRELATGRSCQLILNSELTRPRRMLQGAGRRGKSRSSSIQVRRAVMTFEVAFAFAFRFKFEVEVEGLRSRGEGIPRERRHLSTPVGVRPHHQVPTHEGGQKPSAQALSFYTATSDEQQREATATAVG